MTKLNVSLFFLVFSLVGSYCSMTAQDTWRYVYGGYYNDQSYAVRAVSTDKFVAVGSTGSFGAGSSDIYLIEVNGAGELQWSRTIGGEGIEEARDLQILPNGDLLIVGTINTGSSSGYNGLIIKTNEFGDLIWQKEFGGSDWDFFNKVKVLNEGGFIVVGESYSFAGSGSEAWIMRLDNDGEMLWQQTLGGIFESFGQSVCISPEGEVVMAGTIKKSSVDTDSFIAAFDLNGVSTWFEEHGADSLDIAQDVIPTIDGGFSIVGFTTSFSDKRQAWQLKVSDSGEFEWMVNWNQPENLELFEHLQLPGGEYFSVGYTEASGSGGKDMYLLKTTQTAVFIFGRTFGGEGEDEGFSLDLVDDGIICSGYSDSYGSGSSDFFLVRTNENGQTETEDVYSYFDPLSANDIENLDKKLLPFPNPNDGHFFLKGDLSIRGIKIFDVSGRIVFSKRSEIDEIDEVNVNLAQGHYLIEATNGTGQIFFARFLIVN